MYEIDYEHVLTREIGGVEVTIYFSKEKNERIKDLVLGFLLENYEKRVQDYIEKEVEIGD